MKSKQIIIIILSLILSVICHVAIAQNEIKQTDNQLKQVLAKIDHLQQDLITAKSSQKDTTHALKKTDLRIAQAATQLKQTNRTLYKKERALKRLRVEQGKLQVSIANQRVAMQDQIQILYRLMQQDPIKVMLNQSDSQDMNRTLVYYHYFNQARMALINNMRATLMELHHNEQAIAEQTADLKQLQREQRHNRYAMSHERKQQARLLKTISQQLRDKRRRLTQLNQDKKTLSQLLKRLQKESKDNVGARFLISHKGRLHPPVKGEVVMGFSDSVSSQRNLALHGVIIKAPTGQSVTAIAPGKIVFANWLRGLGLLLIIDHGGGYMSLYGHNQTLTKALGDQVNAGDTIATVGQSGGENSPGLYFALRHRGIAVNPGQWCHFA